VENKTQETFHFSQGGGVPYSETGPLGTYMEKVQRLSGPQLPR